MQGASTLQDLSNYETAKFGPYEWLVLDRSEAGMLLLTKEGIACRPYHEEFEEVTWEKCSLRSWLNGEFMEAAFSVEADTAQLHRLQPLLDIKLVSVPEHVQVLKTEPEQVEYLIIN